jgi:hypothetical protein
VSYRPPGAWPERAWLIGAGLVVVVVLVLAVFAVMEDDERCKNAGGRPVCHTTTITTYGRKGPQFGTITDCRCIGPAGMEIFP